MKVCHLCGKGSVTVAEVLGEGGDYGKTVSGAG